jgi:glycosyltransferase involved in cell wall biosynthesis
MRVLVLHWGRLGAGPRLTARFAEALARLEDTVVYASVEVNADTHPKLDAAHLYLVRTYSTRRQLVTGLPRLLRLALRTRRDIQQEHIDVVFSPMLSIWQSLAIWLIVPRATRFVPIIHDPIEHPGEQHLLIAACRKFELSRADAVCALSDHSATRLKSQLKPHLNTIVIQHPADSISGAQPREFPHGTIIAGFVGRLVEYKGVDVFVDCLQLLQSHQGQPIAGLVAGNGAVDPALRTRSAGFITWDVRWVPESELADVVRRMDLVILPYREASQSGVMPLAASLGVPVVCTPVGGLVEQAAVCGNTLVADAVDAGSVAEAIDRLLADPSTYNELSRRGLENAATQMSWDTAASALAKAFRSIS